MAKRMRLWRSLALPKVPQLRLAAICSAADAMEAPSEVTAPPLPFPGAAARKFGLTYAAAEAGGKPDSAAASGSAGAVTRELAAGLLDRLDGRLRGAGDAQRELGGELALASTRTPSSLRRTMPVATSVSSVISASRRACRRRRTSAAAEVDDRELLAVRLVEAPLRQPHVERHLAALVGVDRDARARLLALDAAAGGLALARARAARDALLLPGGAGIVPEFVQLHVASPLAGRAP